MNNQYIEKATFAGGCFWCMVKPFDQWEGVHSVDSGYTGGTLSNPTYDAVKTGKTGHYEAVQITYDKRFIQYETILDLYWQQIDPTDPDGQFHDRGPQYRTAIFYHSNEQLKAASESKEALEHSKKFKKPIVTSILPAAEFHLAETEHQDFYRKKPEAYSKDRSKSGRDPFIKQHWGHK